MGWRGLVEVPEGRLGHCQETRLDRNAAVANLARFHLIPTGFHGYVLTSELEDSANVTRVGTSRRGIFLKKFGGLLTRSLASGSEQARRRCVHRAPILPFHSQ